MSLKCKVIIETRRQNMNVCHVNLYVILKEINQGMKNDKPTEGQQVIVFKISLLLTG